MRSIDFEYDGRCLSDYGFTICTFGGVPGPERVDAGSVITFNQVATISGAKHRLTSAKYDTCYQAAFDICKCTDNDEDMIISGPELRMIMRWLNRREFLPVRFYSDNDEIDNVCYFNASFNIQQIVHDDRLYGLELTMFTDSPFGYSQKVEFDMAFTLSHTSETISDDSDEIGYCYPDLVITCGANGNLSMTNDMTGCTMTIKNCTSGEVITVKGETQSISSSLLTHDINNDFNYDFFTIGNKFRSRLNKIGCNLPCTVKLSYTPVNKAIP